MNTKHVSNVLNNEHDPRIGFFFFITEMKLSLMKLARQFFQTLGVAMKTCMITL